MSANLFLLSPTSPKLQTQRNLYKQGFKQQMVKLAGHVFKQQSLTFHMLKVHQNQSAGFAGHFATTNTSMSKVRQLNCS